MTQEYMEAEMLRLAKIIGQAYMDLHSLYYSYRKDRERRDALELKLFGGEADTGASGNDIATD